MLEFVIKLKNVWDDLIRLEPNLVMFDPNLRKCWVTKMIPGGGIFSHVDYKRDVAKLIQSVPTKVKLLSLALEVETFILTPGPTLTRTNIPHSVKNETGADRYVIQIADMIPSI